MANSIINCPNCNGEKVIMIGTNQYECQYCGTKFTKAPESTPQKPAVANCPYCGGEILVGSSKCRHCGEWLTRPGQMSQPAPQPVYTQPSSYSQPASYPQQYRSPKSKVTAAILAILLGGFGVHEFYLGRTGAGVAFLLIFLCTCWLIFPMFIICFICFIQAISYLCMSDQEFNAKYN